METFENQYRRLSSGRWKVVVEKGVPLVETRGRPCSDEYVKLITMDVGDSFTSRKSRDSLYQIARNLGIKVSIKSAGRKGWRVWKTSLRVLRRKALISPEVQNYTLAHYGREKVHKERDQASRQFAKGA